MSLVRVFGRRVGVQRCRCASLWLLRVLFRERWRCVIGTCRGTVLRPRRRRQARHPPAVPGQRHLRDGYAQGRRLQERHQHPVRAEVVALSPDMRALTDSSQEVRRGAGHLAVHARRPDTALDPALRHRGVGDEPACACVRGRRAAPHHV